jgi:hypothetical protein
MKQVFISFDFADLDVKQGIVAQSKLPNCPFTFTDNSIKEALSGPWVAEAKRLIAASDFVLVICGDQSHQSKGQETEVQIAKELKKPYALVAGTRKYTPTRPPSASPSEPIHPATWPTIAALLSRPQ